MSLGYAQIPQKFIQPDLFLPNDAIYAFADPPLFLDSIIRFEFSPEIFYLVSKDLSYLIVSGYGVKLSKKSERLLIKDASKIVYEVPFFRLTNVAVMSKGVGVSSDLIEEFAKANISLSFHDFSGKPISLVQSMSSPQHALLKQRQITAQSSKDGLSIIASVVCGKISNQMGLLKYSVKNISGDSQINLLKLSAVKQAVLQMQTCYNKVQTLCRHCQDLTSNTLKEIRRQMMGYEGTAARIYWQAFSQIISEKVEFGARQTRGSLPNDVVNPLLNYGYGILYSKIWSATILAGLDPYIGFLHVEQSGKPSLVFDLIEEFRAAIVDRTVLAYINQSRKIIIKNGLVDTQTRQNFSQKIIERLSSTEYYDGQKVMISDIILSQARKLVGFLEGRHKEYVPYNFKW
ncbi:MAG: CRISPR-associated endonuclease Cas1 [Endomicrobium sp.]|jgi:CRISPR-associated protein Cas1|nr:CRISPR-associated endonuclease Cas1 [Endomicrobium sp.]